jgi:hypothetical protein
MSTYNIKSKGKDICIKIADFKDDIDIESILRIDYSLLIAEIATFSVIINKFGLMLADAQSELSEKKLDLEIYESKRKKEIRNEWLKEKKKFNKDEVEEELSLSNVWQVKKKMYINAEKNRDYINSIYWSCKEKSNKLDKLSMTIKDGDVDFALIEAGIDKLHGVEISNRKKLIPD